MVAQLDARRWHGRGYDTGVSEAPEVIELAVPTAYDLRASFIMQRVGSRDPTSRKEHGRFVKSGMTPDGPTTIELVHHTTGKVRASAWGPGARWVLERAPAWLGGDDRPETFAPEDPTVRRLAKRLVGLRLGKSPFPYDLHAGFVLQQRVTFGEAAESHRRIAYGFGEPAPGPFGTVLFPGYQALRRIPGYEYRRLGVDTKRATALIEAARLASRVAQAAQESLDRVRRYLLAIPGTGPWTAEHLMGYAFGDSDALPTGDVHLPHDVTFALTGEPWGSDDRMTELLEPFRPNRFRVLRLITLVGPRRPYLDRGPPR
mgnify:FL=1